MLASTRQEETNKFEGNDKVLRMKRAAKVNKKEATEAERKMKSAQFGKRIRLEMRKYVPKKGRKIKYR